MTLAQRLLFVGFVVAVTGCSATVAPDAGVLALRVSDLPLGADSGRRNDVPGPFTFGIRLAAG